MNPELATQLRLLVIDAQELLGAVTAEDRRSTQSTRLRRKLAASRVSGRVAMCLGAMKLKGEIHGSAEASPTASSELEKQ